MTEAILIFAGAVLLVLGLGMLLAWLGGHNRWLNDGVLSRGGASKNDRQFIELYYVALVLAPLLCGGILIALGLKRWL